MSMSYSLRSLKLGALALALCLTVAVAGAQIASGAGAGKMRGRTSQGRTIKFRNQGRKLVLLHFAVRLRCRDGSVLTDLESGFQPTRLSHGGRFSDVQYGSTDTVRFRGRVAGGGARGRIRVADKLGHAKCDSRWVKFSAH